VSPHWLNGRQRGSGLSVMSPGRSTPHAKVKLLSVGHGQPGRPARSRRGTPQVPDPAPGTDGRSTIIYYTHWFSTGGEAG
jgi:hypothetical protein